MTPPMTARLWATGHEGCLRSLMDHDLCKLL
jgi:hypothetical protein